MVPLSSLMAALTSTSKRSSPASPLPLLLCLSLLFHHGFPDGDSLDSRRGRVGQTWRPRLEARKPGAWPWPWACDFPPSPARPRARAPDCPPADPPIPPRPSLSGQSVRHSLTPSLTHSLSQSLSESVSRLSLILYGGIGQYSQSNPIKQAHPSNLSDCLVDTPSWPSLPTHLPTHRSRPR